MLILAKLFYIFFKVGMFAFGGGYVILPMIYQEIEKFGIMPSSEFSDIVALSQVTPGPISVNAATYVGFKAAGIMGSVVSTIGVTLPCFIITLLIIAFLDRFKSSPAVKSILVGIRPATVGMLAAAVIFFSEDSIIAKGFFSEGKVFKLFSPSGLAGVQGISSLLSLISLPSIVIFLLTIICSVKFKMGPVLLTILAAAAGILIF
jgi:chromate transporter